MGLSTLYQKLNKRWFANKLPKVTVKFTRFKRNDLHGSFKYKAGSADNKFFAINISDYIRKDYDKVCLTLLHEMVHLKIYVEDPKYDRYLKDHGRRFQKEMRSLAARGAMDKIW